jgi:NTE family protein
MSKKISLVLSGGGARGIAHIGVIEELKSQGFEIGSISGTSMGTLVGGVYALGKMQEFKEWLFSLDKVKTFNLVDFTFSTNGFIKGDKVLNKMKDFIPDSRIEDLEISYRALAVDLNSKSEYVFSEGSIFEAIRASIAIPSILKPVSFKNMLLVDGGVLNNLPINHVQRTDNDILVAVNVNADVPVLKPKLTKKKEESILVSYQNKIKEFYAQLSNINIKSKSESMGYFELIRNTIILMTSQITKLTLEKYNTDILINVSRNSSEAYDFFKAEELVEIGRYAAQKAIEEYNKK